MRYGNDGRTRHADVVMCIRSGAVARADRKPRGVAPYFFSLPALASVFAPKPRRETER